MVTIVDVCMIIIALALVSLIAGLIYVLLDVRKMRTSTEQFIEKIENELNPVLSNIETITGDLAAISSTVRLQIEQMDLAGR